MIFGLYRSGECWADGESSHSFPEISRKSRDFLVQ